LTNCLNFIVKNGQVYYKYYNMLWIHY